VITPILDSCWYGHSTLGLFRADCSSAGSTLALDLQPFRIELNQICIVTGTFTNNSVISLEMEMCSSVIAFLKAPWETADFASIKWQDHHVATGPSLERKAIRPPDCTHSTVRRTAALRIDAYGYSKVCGAIWHFHGPRNHAVTFSHTCKSSVLLNQSQIASARSRTDNAIDGHGKLSKLACDFQPTGLRRFGTAVLPFGWRHRRMFGTNESGSSKLMMSSHFDDTQSALQG
jgi:hypothetical protein